jgi:lactam utilization protein B
MQNDINTIEIIIKINIHCTYHELDYNNMHKLYNPINFRKKRLLNYKVWILNVQ